MRYTLAFLAVLASCIMPVAAQVTPSATYRTNLPQTCTTDTPASRCTLAITVTNPDGSNIGGTSGGGSAGDPSYTGTNGSATIPTTIAVTGGWDGTNLRRFLTDASGRQVVNVNGSVAVTGTFWQATQPVSAAALPLPTGAATAAKQDALVTALGSPLQAGGTVTANLGTLNGAATASNQSTVITALGTLHTDMVAPTPTGENHIGEVAGRTLIVGCGASPCFTTTSATTAWASGQLIGDSATAASVTKMTFTACRLNAGTGMIRRARVNIASDTGFAGQTVIVKLYRDAPTLTNGDRATWLTTDSTYIGSIPVKLAQHFSDYEKGIGIPVDDNGNQTEINYDCAAGTRTLTGLLVTGGALTPQAGSKAVTVVLEALVN